MSWEEYKKKRSKQENNTTISNNNSQLSSWEQYKQKREQAKTESRIKDKMDRVYEEPKQNKIGIKDIFTSGVAGISNGKIFSGSKDAIEGIINPNKVKQEDDRKWFEGGAFKDGYQFGDISKTVTGTMSDIGQDLTKGVAGIGEGLVDTGSYLVDLKSKIEADYIKSMDKSKLTEEQKKDLLKRYIANRQVSQDMRNFIQRDLVEESKIANVAGNAGVAGTINKLLNNRTDNKSDAFESNSVLGDKTDSLVQSAGQLAGQIGLTTIGVPWWVTSGTTAFGGGTEEAFKSGATEEQAGMYGLINTGAEILSEKISGGISFGGKTLDTGLKDVLTKQISNRTVKALTKFGFDATGEGLEEVVTQVLTRLGQKLTYAKEGEWKEILSSPEAMDRWINDTINHLTNEEARAEYGESFIGGFALGGGANTIRLGNSLKNNVDYDTGLPIKQNNTQKQQTILPINKTSQNGLSEQINIANNQETLYNSNESESGINGERQNNTRNQGIFGQYDTNIQQKNQHEKRKYTRQEYEQWEQSIKSVNEANITNEQKIIRDNIKSQYGKNIVFFDDNNSNYNAGASLSNSENIYINLKQANEFGLNKMALHETMESNIVHNKQLKEEIIIPTIRKIIEDPNFQQQKESFWSGQIDDMPSDYAIAKDIIADRFAEIESKEELDYENVLSQETNMTIDFAIDNFQKQIKNNTLANKTMQEAVAPIRKTESNFEKYSKYKKNILDSRAKEVNNLISYKNETIRNIENKIAEKEALLKSKKDKNTKTASVLRTQIENLKTRQQRIDNLYNEKIDKANSKTNRDKINFETRNMIKKEARENLRVEISPLTEDLTKYKDKKAGILYKRETAQRNIDDIVKDKELAQAIKETIFNPVQVHQAQKTREINELFNKINELNLDKTKKYNYVVEDNTINGEVTEEKKNIKIDEATLAQLLIEKKITDTDLINKYNMSNNQINKIHKTADTFTEILDYLYNKMNEEQIKYGYSPIGKLNNYFPHFFENKPDTMLGKIASYFGIDITNQNLPTEIAGRTDIFKPGKTWNSNTLQRKTNKTDYDALKAMEKYIQGATDIIYTTEDIQKIREYERQIRYKYSDKGIQEEIDKIMNDKELTQEAKDKQIESVFKDTENELSNFVTWLNDYGNTLANKKSFSDRSMERDIGRNLYSSMSGIEARIASNTIGGNLSVSLTNFAPLFQASGTTKMNYLLTGMLQTTANNIKGMTGNKSFDFVDNSNFLTNRFGTESIAQKTVTQKISDVASIPMNIIDEFTAESIVRGKYLENINKGMTEEQALDNADKYAAKIMADRSKGALPLIFDAKNPISKLTTMFQVEPNNIISNYLKDMPREATSKAELTKQATKLMVASYAFNTLVMAIRGGNEVLPDPIRWVSYLIKSITGDDDEREQARKDLLESVIGIIPFANNLAGFGLTDLLGIDSNIGRIPIANAMPSITNVVKAFDSEADSEYRKETAMKELLKPFIYLGLPTGGAQLKKTIEGISTVSAGGSYKTDKEGNKILQFPVENPNAGDYIRAGILGKYSLPMAKEYQDRNFKSLSAKQTKTYEESNLPYKEYLEYIDQKLKTNEDKINYLSEKDWNENQKWGIYTNDIFSSTERKKDGGSQLSDAKYIVSNGVSKSEYIELYNKAQKNNIDMPTKTEYKEMKSNGITLKTYIDYKEKIAQETIKQRSSGNLKEDGSLKDKDKMLILINSNYSNKEKQSLYENYIKSKTDEKYDILKTINNFNIESYLEYKLASNNGEFSADRKDDGTLSGKTISGSAKNKKFNYISNMKNTPHMQKAILFGLESTPNNNDKTKIVNYITSLSGKTNKEKLEMLDQFSWVTIYKDGSYKY